MRGERRERERRRRARCDLLEWAALQRRVSDAASQPARSLSLPALLSTFYSLLSRAAPLPDGSQSLAVDPPRGRVKKREGEQKREAR